MDAQKPLPGALSERDRSRAISERSRMQVKGLTKPANCRGNGAFLAQSFSAK
jgi:hypothetical protein